MRHWQWKYNELGTTNFRGYMCKDFDKELEDIEREFKKLGLKKN